MPQILQFRFWLAALLLLAPVIVHGQSTATKVVGRMIGEATVVDVRDPMRPRVLNSRDELTEGQIVTTGKGARVLLVFSNGATVNLAAQSSLAIDEFLQDPFAHPVKASELAAEPTTSTTKLNLLRGELMSNVKKLNREKGSSFTIQTPVGAAGIRGTTFQLVYRPLGNVASFALRMIEGRIALDFGALTRSVEVDGDHQVVLENVLLDASGRVISLPANVKPVVLPASIKAALAADQQLLLEAAASVSFSPMTASGRSAPQQAYPQPTSSSSLDVNSANGQGNPSAFPLSAVPPATPPPPRTTPGDGQL
jgi:hypothetical protein